MIGSHESHKLGKVGNVGRTPGIDTSQLGGKSVNCRKLSALVLSATMGVGLLGNAPMTRADWVHEITATGTTLIDEPPQNPVTYPWSNYTPTSSSGGLISWPNGTGAKLEQKGSVVDVWTWVRGKLADGVTPDPADNPPAVLILRINANANAYSSSAVYDTSWRDASKETATASAMGGSATAVDSTYGTAADAGGAILKSFPVGADGKVTVTAPLEARAELAEHYRTYFGSSYKSPIQGYLTASVYYSAGVDDRGVRLSRGGGAKQEGALGVTIDPERDEWIARDGTAHGQSRWSYTSRDSLSDEANDYADTPIEYATAISAQQSGNGWSSNLLGIWSPSHYMDRRPPEHLDASHIQNLPDGGSFQNNAGWNLGLIVEKGWYNVPSSGPANPVEVSYKLKDLSDNAEAEGKYILHLHDEWEHPTDNSDESWTDEIGTVHPSESRRGPFLRGLPVSPSTYSGTNGDPHPVEWKVEWSAEQKATLTGTFDASFKIKDWLNIGGSFESESSLSITASVASSAYATLVPGDTAFPVIKYFINTKHRLVDQYEVGGCRLNPARTDGKWDKSADLPLRPQDIRPDWTIVHNGGNNPTP